ncbi:hypothetical protein HII31_06232, partial [Pseudocercospora fuligena]
VSVVFSEPFKKAHIDTTSFSRVSTNATDDEDIVQGSRNAARCDSDSGTIEDTDSIDDFLIEQYKQSAAHTSEEIQSLYRVYKHTIEEESLSHFNVLRNRDKVRPPTPNVIDDAETLQDDSNFNTISEPISRTIFEQMRIHTNDVRLRQVVRDNGRSPVYPKIHLDYIELATLRYYDLPWEYDSNDTNYIIILRDMAKRETDILFDHSVRLRNARLLLEDSRENGVASSEPGVIHYGKSPIYSAEPTELPERGHGGIITPQPGALDHALDHVLTREAQDTSNSTSKATSSSERKNDESKRDLTREVAIKRNAFIRRKTAQQPASLTSLNDTLKRTYRHIRMAYGRRHSVGTGIWQTIEPTEVQYWSDPNDITSDTESESEDGDST